MPNLVNAVLHSHLRYPGKIDAGIKGNTPDAISGLFSWYSADYLTGYADGDPVPTWIDRVGGLRNGTSAGANRPTYKTNIVNGLPVLRCAGNQGFQVLPVDLTTGTYFVVWSRTNAANNDVILLYDGSSYSYLQYGSSWYYIGGTAETVAMDAGVFKLKCGKYDGANITLYTNGGQDASPASSGHMKWSYLGGYGFNCNGDIAEIIMYNAALSDSDRQFVEAYINSKYDLW